MAAGAAKRTIEVKPQFFFLFFALTAGKSRGLDPCLCLLIVGLLLLLDLFALGLGQFSVLSFQFAVLSVCDSSIGLPFLACSMNLFVLKL